MTFAYDTGSYLYIVPTVQAIHIWSQLYLLRVLFLHIHIHTIFCMHLTCKNAWTSSADVLPPDCISSREQWLGSSARSVSQKDTGPLSSGSGRLRCGRLGGVGRLAQWVYKTSGLPRKVASAAKSHFFVEVQYVSGYCHPAGWDIAFCESIFFDWSLCRLGSFPHILHICSVIPQGCKMSNHSKPEPTDRLWKETIPTYNCISK